MPEPDIQTLLGQLQATANQPLYRSPTQQLGGILSGAAAGYRGQTNPVIDQLQQQRDLQLRQQMEMIRLQQSVQKQRMEKRHMELGIYRDLLGSASPEGRKMGATGLAGYLKESGQQVSPGFVESFEAGHLSADARKQAYLSILAAQSAPDLTTNLDTYLERSLNVPKSMIPSLKAEAQSPAIYKMLYGKTPQQETRELAKAEREERKVDLTEKRLDLSEARERRMEREGQQRFLQAEERLHLAQLASERADKKFDWLTAHGPEEKRQRGLDQGEMFVNQWEAAALKLQERGYLPPPGAAIYDPAYLAARAKRITSPNDPYWTLFSKHLKADIVGYSRNVQGEIGPRFQAAFTGALGIADNPPDIESLKKVFRTMRDVIKLNREGKDTAMFIYIKHPDGSIGRVPWKRGMSYAEGDVVIKVE